MRNSTGYRIFQVCNTIVLLVVVVLTLYPFVNIVAQSFSDEAAISSGRVNLLPVGFNLETYKVIMGDPTFWLNYRNTVVYTVVATALSLALTTCMAYALSKKHLRGRKFFVGFVVFTMFFNGGLIPNYVLVSELGLKNTIWAVVLPNAISVFNLLVMKTFFENMPTELEEAAAIDGLTTYGVLLRIVLPLSKAILATMALFYAVANWNSWFGAFLYFDQKSMFPVTMYLRNLIAGAETATSVGGGDDISQIASNVKAVTMVLTVLPILCVYPFVQRHFVSGVMLGAVKG
ncbi:carbohydrate ABC transporter permease [Goodfellowiella coeruleoviolacea]|uniref:Carbohydrate ABC transporter membrane protein 2, CUT1 family n=1 Tax=Goodfellowiella coeruleoviolacea TaxID=334858 RepID=A0AAE3G7Z9_9PSEU|nr:carbohydrate ABC transporter permease [Goodfellowiella coeruleoviolacea]MCP2163391.1 carbohydrate ABC transporter membrane protein 2, CUT1 family [Goodfellowiella coeruleoviolacea]